MDKRVWRRLGRAVGMPVGLAGALLFLLWAALSLPAHAAPAPDPTAPLPQHLRASRIFTDGFSLAWAPVNVNLGGKYLVRVAERWDSAALVETSTVDLLTSQVTVTGLAPGHSYFVEVRTFVPAQGSLPTPHVSEPARLGVATASDAVVLVAIYLAADNDLSPYIPVIQRRLLAGSAANPNVRVVYLSDGDQQGDTQVVEIAAGRLITTTAVLDRWGKNELDTADPAVLGWFLSYARSRYPGAQKSIVSLIGHGVALAPDLAWLPPTDPGQPSAGLQPGVPPLPQGHDYTPGDVTDGGYLSAADLGEALAAATAGGAQPFDVLFLDQCFQGSLDLLYEVRSYAHVIVASPNYAWLVAPYALYLPYFAPANGAEAIGDAIIHIYQLLLTNASPNSIFWIRSADIEAAAAAVSHLGDALRAALAVAPAATAQRRIGEAAQAAQYVDTTQCGPGKFDLAPPDELLGAASFARSLKVHFPDGDPAGVRAAADAVVSALAVVSSTARVGHPSVAPLETWRYTDTLTILAPLLRTLSPSVAWRSSIYTRTGDFQAVWSPAPTQTVIVSRTFAFARDGHWSDFIGQWYTGPLTPTIGQWCNYTPPSTADAGSAAALTVQSAVQNGGLALQWTPPDGVSPALYQVFVRRPDGVGDVLSAALDADQLRYVFARPGPGAYQIVVTAVDGQGAVLAISDPIAWEVVNHQVYLPAVRR